MAVLQTRKLSNRAAAVVSVERDTVFWDREFNGFGVRVHPTGGKVFVAHARGADGPDCPWVVPGAKPDTHMTDIDGARQSIQARAGLHDVRINDIRHSFASEAFALARVCRLWIGCLVTTGWR